MLNSEERKLVMDVGKELIMELKELNRKVNHVINRLIEAGDSLILSSADEHSAGQSMIKKSIVYRRPTNSSEGLDGASTEATGPIAKGTRTCGTCGKPGHNARTCPDADKAYRAARQPEPESTGPFRRARRG